jgi:uncharacterized protein
MPSATVGGGHGGQGRIEPLDNERAGRICRKAADYMPSIEGLTRRAPQSAGKAGTPRVVIDTNALLDWLVFGVPAAVRLGQAVAQRQWTWCATPPMLRELRAVLERPLPNRWEPARELALTRDPAPLAVEWPPAMVQPPREALHCRDGADQMFIDLALACSPAWLVTRDRALLALRRRAAQRGVVIGTPEQWDQRAQQVLPPMPAPP